MNTKFLIDAIVHQTTVLIAQLSTASGIRAPLSHVADQVFLELSREIEAQGVSRKVVADMFGLAIRTYQKKVQRVTESVTARYRTLWQAVLEYLQEQGSCSRRELQAPASPPPTAAQFPPPPCLPHNIHGRLRHGSAPSRGRRGW